MALACASNASAQSFNQELSRYRFAKQNCAQAYERQLARKPDCVGSCLAAATTRRDRCLNAAEQRYRAVLRRELRPRP